MTERAGTVGTAARDHRAEGVRLAQPAPSPKRIQRSRSKNWRMPVNAFYVGRPTKWGNPFIIGQDGNREECVKLHALLASGLLCISKSAEHIESQKRAHRAMGKAKVELKGKDLVCWCPPNKPCHADLLLKIANEKEKQ